MTSVGDARTGADDPFARLLAAAADGEEWAWTQIHQRYGARLRGLLAARGAPDPDTAVGEVLVLVARALPRFEGDEEEFDIEVFAAALRHLDSDPRRIVEAGDADDRPPPPSGAAPRVLPTHVTGVLGQLEPLERDAVLLASVAGLSPAQVGGVLGLDPESADAATKRGLSGLSEVLF